MSVTHSTGISKLVNFAIVESTLIFSAISAASLIYTAAHLSFSATSINSVIFGLSFLVCALCSRMYTKRQNVEDRRFWRHLDHASIFLLIAGTYTPFVTGINSALGLSLMQWTWGLAGFGIAMRLIIRKGYDRLFIGLYVLIGWLFLIELKVIVGRTDVVSLYLLGAGALAYTFGALVFAYDIGKWTDPVWHLSVFAGGYLHFLAVLNYLLLASVELIAVSVR